jgi:hypothetical protein
METRQETVPEPLFSPAPARGEEGQVVLRVLLGLTVAGLLWHALAHARLRWRRRGWREASLDGVQLLVARRFGPAIVGVLRPRIVVPEWALSLPSEDRALLLLHELEHLRAHDAQLMWAARASAAVMPWNLPLAWQLARLRLAVEVDCDARVLRARPDARRYGTLLIEVARRTIGAPVAVTAFAERRSALRRRIECMTPQAGRLPVQRAVLAGFGALLLAGTAAAVPRPDRPPPLLPPPARGGLPLGVADSVTTMAGRPIGAGRDLPAAFIVESFPPDANREGARCAQYLLDPRDNTRLQLARTFDDAVRYERGDTVAVHHRSLGFYRVRQVPGAYGLSEASLLRVGCNDRAQITVRGQPFGIRVTTLDTPGDDRARALAAAIASAELLYPTASNCDPAECT